MKTLVEIKKTKKVKSNRKNWTVFECVDTDDNIYLVNLSQAYFKFPNGVIFGAKVMETYMSLTNIIMPSKFWLGNENKYGYRSIQLCKGKK